MHFDAVTESKSRLFSLLQEKSIFYGDFLLASGRRSHYYIDCRLTTLDPEGAWLIGEVMHSLICVEARERQTKVDAIGGLTMGADPIALATAIFSYSKKDAPPLRPFVVRKEAKGHGQTKLIEGSFKSGDTVVVLDDVVTRGDSTIKAMETIVQAGGKIAFAAVLVDRQEGGRQNIEKLGYPLISVFTRDELVREAKT